MESEHPHESTDATSHDEEQHQGSQYQFSRRDILRAGAVAVPVVALPAALSLPGVATAAQAATGTAADTLASGSLVSFPSTSPPAQLTGRVVWPLSDTYAQDRIDFDALYQSYPLVIVFAQNTQDVVNALRWARQNDVAVQVRSGRHSLAGWSNVTGGIVIDVSELKTPQDIDAKNNTVTVGPGLTQLEVVDFLGASGFATTTGSEGTVGFSGASLGGGFGLLVRQLGMACDNILEAQVVVPSGTNGAEVVTASQSTNPDLLFALRGPAMANSGS